MTSRPVIVRTSPEDAVYLTREQVMRTSLFQLKKAGKKYSEEIRFRILPGLSIIFTFVVAIVGNPFSGDTSSFDTSTLYPYLVGAVVFFVTQCWAAFMIYTKHTESLHYQWFKHVEWSAHFGDVGDVELLLITGDDTRELQLYYEKHADHLKDGMHDLFLTFDRMHRDVSVRLREEARCEGDSIQLGLWHESRLVGLVNADIDAPKVELSYSIAPTHQGRGYITRTVALLRDYAFEELDAELVRIRCEHTNTRSVNVAKRAGFHLAGHVTRTFHTGSRWLDVDYYHMHLDQWRASRGDEEE